MSKEKIIWAGNQEETIQQISAKDSDIHSIQTLMEEKCKDPDVLYRALVTRIQKYHPSADISMIEKAYRIAKNAHQGQLRKSGEEYIIHPLWVAIILANLELDKETIVAAMLHDVVEDTIMTKEEIEQEFGTDVALLVEGVTKLGQLSYSTDKVEVQAENLRKMFLAMAKDIRVILIKLADRLHNMRTLQYMKPDKQKEKSRETMDIYSPIARRLGISKIKTELDDLALKYLEPVAYEELEKEINERHAERDQFIKEMVDEVSAHMKEGKIKAEVYGRVKHFFSIYRKMIKQEKTVDEIYDLFAVRIIVDNVRDCYGALGLIHEKYTPIPGRFKDYIAMPKANMYQSLHTTLISTKGKPFEVQIRTREMHKTAEYGIAAHWKYKESGNSKETAATGGEEAKLTWLRQILEWQQDMSDNQEFLSLLKGDLDLFSDDVYCFTPDGDVKNLPIGSTPVDFAYSIHSAVGNRMVGARANGKLVKVDYQIQNGDRLEIITSQNSRGPSRDWLNIVKSTQAKNKINQWFRQEFKEENIIRGKEMLLSYCKSKGYNIGEITKPKYIQAVLRKYGFRDWDSAMAALGHGGLKEGQIVNRLIVEYEKEHKKELLNQTIHEQINSVDTSKLRVTKSKSGVVVKGIDDVAVHFSGCCNPVPGDEIVGFVTRGRGLSIHRTDCINILHMTELERERLIPAEWGQTGEDSGKYLANIKIYANDRSGLLMDILRIFTENNIDVKSLNTNASKQGRASVDAGFAVGGREELNRLIGKLRQIESVLDIQRTLS